MAQKNVVVENWKNTFPSWIRELPVDDWNHLAISNHLLTHMQATPQQVSLFWSLVFNEPIVLSHTESGSFILYLPDCTFHVHQLTGLLKFVRKNHNPQVKVRLLVG